MPSVVDMLFVDDNPADVVLFTRAVAKTNLNVRLQTLAAGQEAIDYLEAKGKYADRSSHPFPEIIVLDLKMPELNGFDFLAWRKVSVLFRTIPVVIFSGCLRCIVVWTNWSNTRRRSSAICRSAGRICLPGASTCCFMT